MAVGAVAAAAVSAVAAAVSVSAGLAFPAGAAAAAAAGAAAAASAVPSRRYNKFHEEDFNKSNNEAKSAAKGKNTKKMMHSR